MTIPVGHRFEATQALRQVLNRALEWGLIDINPAKTGVDNPVGPSDYVRPEVVVTTREDVRVVELSGDHDVTTVTDVRAAIVDGASRENVVVSLQLVTFIDSSIIGTLFTGYRALIENGIQLVIHCPLTTPICRQLRYAHLEQVIHVVDTLEEAVDRAAAATTTSTTTPATQASASRQCFPAPGRPGTTPAQLPAGRHHDRRISRTLRRSLYGLGVMSSPSSRSRSKTIRCARTVRS